MKNYNFAKLFNSLSNCFKNIASNKGLSDPIMSTKSSLLTVKKFKYNLFTYLNMIPLRTVFNNNFKS